MTRRKAEPTQRTLPDTEPPPDRVRDEAILMAPGEPEYWLLLDEATVEAMASGVCPEAIALRCFGMLEWKRRAARMQAREDARVVA